MCVKIFMKVIFKIKKRWKEIKGLKMMSWWLKLCYIYIVKYDVVIKCVVV